MLVLSESASFRQMDRIRVRLGESPNQLVTMEHTLTDQKCSGDHVSQRNSRCIPEDRKTQENGGNVNGSYRRC